MGIIIRQGLKNSIVTYFGVVIGVINILFLFNKFLTPEQLGLYAAITSFPVVFASFSNLGTPHIAVRFFNQFENPANKHNGFFGYLLLAPLVGFSINLIFYLLLHDTFCNVYAHNSSLLVT